MSNELICFLDCYPRHVMNRFTYS